MGYCVLLCNVCSMHASLAFPENLNANEVKIVAEAVTSEQFGYWQSLASAFPDSDRDTGSSLYILVAAWKAMNSKERESNGINIR
jgi:lipoate synthase